MICNWKRTLHLVEVMLLAALLMATGRAQVATTQIVDTIYRADGTPASGSLLVSWPAFTTSSSQAVPAGKTEVPINSDGTVAFGLAPNSGALPAGSFYTAVYHLGDGTVSTEYWTVPQAKQTSIAAIRSSVVPATVAVQSASVSYVDQQISEAVTGYLPLSGGTLTGPLYLSEDPLQSAEAATKNYVDENLGAVGGGLTSKLNISPSTTQTVTQPAGTTLAVTSLQNILYAGPNQTGAGNNGIANSMAQPACSAGGCLVVADPGYSTTEEPQGHPLPACFGGEFGAPDGDYCAYQWPINSRLWDQRGGTDVFAYQDTVNRFGGLGKKYPLNYPSGASPDGATAQQYIYDYDVDYGNSQIVSFEQVQHQFAGGHNANYGAGWGKTNTELGQWKTVNFSLGQHSLVPQLNFCLGLGDCMGSPLTLIYATGMNSPSDEGIHRGDAAIEEDANVFQGSCKTGCTAYSSGSSQTIVTTPTQGLGDIGEGRMALDISQPSGGNLGTVVLGQGTGQIIGQVSSSGNVPLQFVAPAGTFNPSTAIGTTSVAIVAPSGQGFPGNTTLAISVSSGSFTTGVACISDKYAFEMVNLTAASASSITANFRRPHLTGALLTQGGTCGWALTPNADTVTSGTGNVIRVALPLLGSVDSAHTYVNTFIGGSYAGEGTAWTYNTATGSATYNNGTVTVTGNFGFQYPESLNGNFGNVYGQSLTIASTADSSDAAYNGSYPVTVLSSTPTGATFTYPYTGHAPGNTGSPTPVSVTVTECNCTFTMYPRAEVIGVYNSTSKQVDGTLTLEPNAIPFATGDTIEVAHWHQPAVNDNHDFITTHTPQSQVWGRGFSYGGNVSGNLLGFSVQSTASMSQYQGYGGWAAPPTTNLYLGGWWNDTETIVNAPKTAVLSIGCKPSTTNQSTGNSNNDGCTKWDAAYSVLQLNAFNGSSSVVGGASLNFDPNANNFSFVNSNASGYCTETVGAAVGTVGGTTVGGIGLTNSSNCALLAHGIALNGAATELTGQSGTGSSIVTNTGPTITGATLSGATLTGTTTVPASQTLTVAGNLNITGSCSGCTVSVPGTSGEFLMSNGSSGFGTPADSTGTGNVMLANSPTTTGVLTAANINATGTLNQAGAANLNTTGSALTTIGNASSTLNVNAGTVNIGAANGGNVTIGSGSLGNTSIGGYTTFTGPSVTFNGGENITGPFIMNASATATAAAPLQNSSQFQIKGSVWTGSAACTPFLAPQLVFNTTTSWSYSFTNANFNRTVCPGLTPSITADFSTFLDGFKATHYLSGGPAPGITAGTGAGSAGTVSLSNATDVKGVITVTAGTSPAAGAVVATVTFGSAYLQTPVCSVTPASASAMNTVYSPAASSSSFTVNTGAASLSAGSTYIYSYQCLD
jgi:hypothetical protein